MVGARKENFLPEEKEYIVQYVSANRNILENKSNKENLYLTKRDKWRDLAKNLEKYGVRRDWKEVRNAYQKWKASAKKNIVAFRKWGDNIPVGLHRPTDFDYTIYHISPQDFEENDPLNDCENNRVTSEDNELSNVVATTSFSEPCHTMVYASQFTEKSTEHEVDKYTDSQRVTSEDNELSNVVTTTSFSEPCHTIVYASQFTEKSTEHEVDKYTDSQILTTKPGLYVKKECMQELPNTYKETRDLIPEWPNLNVPASSTDFTYKSEVLSITDIVEPVSEEQRTYSDNDHETLIHEEISNDTNPSSEFKQQENMLRLKILRAQLNREKEESNIRMKQEKVKLAILKLQLKREKRLLKNIGKD